MAGPGAHFSGRYDNRLSAKGQVAVPARLRQLVPETDRERGFVLLPGRERCLYMYPEAEFAGLMTRVRGVASGMEGEGSEFFRAFLESAVPVEIDAQGRMVIPEALRTVAGITGDVVTFVGVDERIELWDPAERKQSRMSDERFAERRAAFGNEIFGL